MQWPEPYEAVGCFALGAARYVFRIQEEPELSAFLALERFRPIVRSKEIDYIAHGPWFLLHYL